jgi:AraC family transcriptional regulator
VLRAELIQARQFVDEHLDQPLTLAQLSQEVGLSPFHFARLFKAAFGTSPHQFILQRRLERCWDLLCESSLSLTQIAMATGFGDQSHLSRSFRRHFGKTPQEARLGEKQKNSKNRQNSQRVSP